MYETMSFLIFVTLSFLCVVRGKLTEVIQTDKGPVQGEIVQTVQNSSIEYSSFRAIPFAKPPIGVLRFQPPVEADVWLETLNATSDAPPCPQINFEDIYVGVEDCLYLNVYSPKTSFENGEDKELLAVMVWLYGGEFLFGDITKTRFGPDFVIVENVIIVNINYRLGALGFLSLNTATGNMGLKDQVLALKWVQKNIDKFGGDPKKVTIFGQSAGAVSAMLHQISPASKGLFRAVIAMSGSPLERWAFNPMSLEVEQGLDVAKRLELTNDSKYQLLQEYKNKSAEELVHGVKNGFTKGGISLLHFTPTVENSSIAKDIFLSECPLKNYQSGNFTDLPVILGFMGSETLFFTRIFRGLFRLINTVDTFIRQTFESINSPIFKILYWIIKINEKLWIYMIHTVFYISIKITTDVIFVAGIDSTQKYLVQSSSSPIYYYRNSFDYEHSYHRTLGIDLDGAAHVDDVYEIFYQSNRTYLLDPESRINTQIKRMVKLWTNFAKYLDPTPDGKADPLLNVTWSPSGSEGLHLEIGNEKLTMGPRPASFIVWLVQLLSKPIESFVAGC